MIGLPWMKKLWRYVKPFRCNTGTWRTDGRTDRIPINNTDIDCAQSHNTFSIAMLTRDKNCSKKFSAKSYVIEPTARSCYCTVPCKRDRCVDAELDTVLQARRDAWRRREKDAVSEARWWRGVVAGDRWCQGCRDWGAAARQRLTPLSNTSAGSARCLDSSADARCVGAGLPRMDRHLEKLQLPTDRPGL